MFCFRAFFSRTLQKFEKCKKCWKKHGILHHTNFSSFGAFAQAPFFPLLCHSFFPHFRWFASALIFLRRMLGKMRPNTTRATCIALALKKKTPSFHYFRNPASRIFTVCFCIGCTRCLRRARDNLPKKTRTTRRRTGTRPRSIFILGHAGGMLSICFSGAFSRTLQKKENAKMLENMAYYAIPLF